MTSNILSPIVIPIVPNTTNTNAGHTTVISVANVEFSSKEQSVTCNTILAIIPPSTKYNARQPMNISIFISVSNVAASSFYDHTARPVSPFVLCFLLALYLLLHEKSYTQGTLNGSLNIFSYSLCMVSVPFFQFLLCSI